MKNRHWWHDLTEEEKRVIHNPEDIPIISVIDGMPLNTKQLIYKELDTLPSLAGKVYYTGQEPWLDDFGYYLWQNKLHSDPTINIQKTVLFLDELDRTPLRKDYRLCFAAKNSHLIKNNPMSKELISFLSEIYEVTEGKFGQSFKEKSGIVN